MQILTTAIFSVTMLRRSLGMKRWISLIILTLGVSIVSLPQPSSGAHADPATGASILLHDTSDHFFPRSVHELGQAAEGAAEVARELTKRAADGLAGVGENVVGSVIAKRSASYQGIQEDQDIAPLMNYSIGLSAVLVAAVASGLAGVYFEKMLKDSATPASVWTRNIQLSFYSLFPALAGVIFKDGEDIARHGFFEGYNWVVWTAIVFQALGGVLASLCINYADNIAKNFAASISIVISFLFSVWFFNFQVNFSVRIKPPIPSCGNVLLTNFSVPRWHGVCSRFDLPIQHSRPQGPPAPNHHRELRKGYGRPGLHATGHGRDQTEPRPVGLGPQHGLVHIPAIVAHAASPPCPLCQGQEPRRLICATALIGVPSRSNDFVIHGWQRSQALG